MLSCLLHLPAFGQTAASIINNQNCRPVVVHHYHWPKQWHLRAKSYLNFVPVEYGTITLQDGNSISGLLSLYRISSKYADLVILPEDKIAFGSMGYLQTFYGGETGAMLNENDEGSRIKRVRIYKDSVDKQCYVDFISLIKPFQLRNFWQVIGEKNDIRICDRFMFSSNTSKNDEYASGGWESEIPETSHHLILTTKSEAVIIPRGLFESNQSVLKRFIKNRYKIDVKQHHFNTISEMINFILNAESAK